MKRYETIIALAAMLTLTNCGTVTFDKEESVDKNELTADTNTKTVTFHADDIQLAGISDETMNNTRTRADKLSTDVKDRCKYLQYWIFNSDYTEIVASGVQTSTDTDFGTFSATLYYDTYNVVVIGHNQTNKMTLDEETLMVNLGGGEEKNLDTYYCNKTCTVAANSENSFSFTMKRNMCYVRIKSLSSTKKIGTIDICRTAYGSSFSVKNGYSKTGTEDFYYTLTLSDEDRKKESYTIGMYFVLPNDEVCENVSLMITAKDTNDKEIKTTTISNIPAKIGRCIVYEGVLWGDDASFVVTVSDEDWEIVNKTY